MNLGDVMRELGLDSLVPDSRSRESTDESEDAATETDDESADASGDESDSEASRSSSGISTDELASDVGDAIDDLRYDLDEVESRVDEYETTIESIQDDQERLEDRLDDLEETNATLLGVYDRLTEEVNPFSGSVNGEDVGPDEETYGVMTGEADDGSDDAASDDEVVSFSDVKEEISDAASESEDESDERADGADESADGNGDQSPDREQDAPAEPEPADSGTVAESGPDTAESPYLDALAPTYATDVLLMQWLSMLVDTAGPAGALKTLDYYAQINWISPQVKRELETVLSGAYDVDEDAPSRPPSELSVEAHNESFEHIQRLAQQTELANA